jgi:heme-degrading monooxygenase HmoA
VLARLDSNGLSRGDFGDDKPEGGLMWARVSTYEFPPNEVDEAITRFNEALGDLREPGLERAELLVHRESGKGMTITVWESERALQESVQAADRLRSDAADAAGVTIVGVEHYEIVRRDG